MVDIKDHISIEQCKKAIKEKAKGAKKDNTNPTHNGDEQHPKITALLEHIDMMADEEKGIVRYASF